MKAVVLVGGEGTRLRPLTETIPKPLVPLVDRSSLHHVLDHLAAHGVHEVILSSSYLEDAFRVFVLERHGDPGIRWVTETTPLGTAGAIVSALDDLDETFLVLNGDILTDLDITSMVAFHRERDATATIALTHVSDARPFGLVPVAANGRVMEFREKPPELVPGDVNAGTYVLEPDALSGWPRGEAMSGERQVFPAMIESGRPAFGYLSGGYWLGLGTPEKYLQAHEDLLEGRVGGERYATPFVADGAELDPAAHVGRVVSLGAGARVGPRAVVDRSVLLSGAVVEEGALVEDSILGPRARIGRAASVRGCVLAEGASVPQGARLAGARVSAFEVAAARGAIPSGP